MAMGEATVRRVEVGDTARIRAIRLEMLADSPLAFLQRLADAAAIPHAEWQARTTERATSPDNAAFVAEVDGRVIGHAGAWAMPGSVGTTTIYAVYVTPSRRGGGVLGQLVDA